VAARYSSWVVRAWTRDERGTVRLTIEEVRSGRLVELRGERAADIEGVISAAYVGAANGSTDGGPEAGDAQAPDPLLDLRR
jgi:hypothetical protein